MPSCRTLSVDTLKEMVTTEYVVGFKFVNVGNEYRFCDTIDSHCSLVNPGETAVSAGTIVLYKNKMIIENSYSTTLGISMKRILRKCLVLNLRVSGTR